MSCNAMQCDVMHCNVMQYRRHGETVFCLHENVCKINAHELMFQEASNFVFYWYMIQLHEGNIQMFFRHVAQDKEPKIISSPSYFTFKPKFYSLWSLCIYANQRRLFMTLWLILISKFTTKLIDFIFQHITSLYVIYPDNLKYYYIT